MADLRVLHLYGGEGAPDGLQPLIDAAPPLLHTLSLRGASFEDDPVIAFARSPASDTLHELNLTENQLGPAAAAALGASRSTYAPCSCCGWATTRWANRR